MLPTRLKVYNFRSIGSEGVDLGDLKKANIIIGRNNTGKSNVIRAVKTAVDLIKAAGRNSRISIDPLDRHMRNPQNPFKIEVDFPLLEGPKYDYLRQRFDTVSYVISVDDDNNVSASQSTINVDKDFDYIRDWWMNINDFRGGTLYEDRIRRDISAALGEILLENSKLLKSPITIPEFRQITESSDEYDISGKNLIGKLARLKNPTIDRDADVLKFQVIERFFKNLLNLDEDASISISTDNPTIIIQNRGIRLPISYYGTGVHQLIILITAVMIEEDVLFGIEEPEIHLHPQLQRAFIDFLIRETKNKYIITTHSSSLINMPFLGNAMMRDNMSVVALTTGEGTTGRPIAKENEALDAMRDVGINASDLLQSTGIIWIEGPSDRIYINRWINLRASELREGVHYHFIYYGGKLLSHYEVKADGEEIDGLINLLKINRNSIIVIDSDKRSDSSGIAEFKIRIQDQATASGIECWITDGREIENYLASDAVIQAFGPKTSSYSLDKFEKIDDVLKAATGPAYEYNKVGYSKRIAEHITLDQAPHDLEDRMQTLIALIRRWNSLPTPPQP